MRTLVVGCNHRSAPVEVRERIAFDERSIPRALAELARRFPGVEAVILSTCNRMEVYVAQPVQGRPRVAEIVAFIAEFHGLAADEFAQGLYSFEDIEAVRHLFCVASSLDSMVLGESQILAQAKRGYGLARSAGTTGRRLDGLFQRALAVAKEVHTKTAIATGRVSVGSTAVDLARQIFSHFDDKTVMMVGAGKMGELTLIHLLSMRPRRLWITNRTDERAAALARRLSETHRLIAEAVPFARWIDRLAAADIVISSTGSPEPILAASQFAPIPACRRYRPLLLIDIAVPRDIEPAVGEHDSVFLYNIDDLQAVVDANLLHRREALDHCLEIVEAHVTEFVQRQAQAEVGPLIEALRRHFQEIGRRELDWLLSKLDTAGPHDRELIQQMVHRLQQKLLHDPIHLLNDMSADGAAGVYGEALRALFNLDAVEPPP